MNLAIALALAALAASVHLGLRSPARPWAVAAAVASGVKVAIAFGWLSIRVANVPLHLVIAAVIAVCGGVLFARVSAKNQVAGATVIALVGLIGVSRALGLLR